MHLGGQQWHFLFAPRPASVYGMCKGKLLWAEASCCVAPSVCEPGRDCRGYGCSASDLPWVLGWGWLVNRIVVPALELPPPPPPSLPQCCSAMPWERPPCALQGCPAGSASLGEILGSSFFHPSPTLPNWQYCSSPMHPVWRGASRWGRDRPAWGGSCHSEGRGC